MSTAKGPQSITIRSYDVGFGDCFLLTFHYARPEPEDRHILIDFGSFPQKKIGKQSILDRVADEIVRDCGGTLHAVVATHRHADHINGLRTDSKTKSGPGDKIAGCRPKVVIQPWTEDPHAQPDAKTASRPLPAGNRAFVASLHSMQQIAAFALREAEQNKGLLKEVSGLGIQKTRELAFLGGNNISNRSAVENLMAMGSRKGSKAFYVHYGSQSGLEKILPGVTTYVLGPPTLEQSSSIREQRQSDPDEFWQLVAAGMPKSGPSKGRLPFAHSTVDRRAKSRPYTRWLVPRLRALRGDQLLDIVRKLDDQMNNTSVILAFRTKNQVLLFPGDAQIENWSYALKEAENSARVRKLLQGVTFYKVGHHGSRNATPRSLWDGFAQKDSTDGPLTTMLSTESGHHGSSVNKSEVPRKTLVDELIKHTHFFTTEKIKGERPKQKGTKHVVQLPA